MKKSGNASRSKFFPSGKNAKRKNKKRGDGKKKTGTFVSVKTPSMFVEHRNR